MRNLSKRKKTWIIVGIILFVLVIIGQFAPDQPSEPKKPVSKYNEDLSYFAYLVSKDFVKQNLKAPSTADFMSEYETYKKDSATYIVISSLDAQNDFGAMLRKKYKVILKYKGGDNYPIYKGWDLLDIEFE